MIPKGMSTFDMSFCKVAFLKTDEFEAFATLSSICKVQGWGQGSKGWSLLRKARNSKVYKNILEGYKSTWMKYSDITWRNFPQMVVWFFGNPPKNHLTISEIWRLAIFDHFQPELTESYSSKFIKEGSGWIFCHKIQHSSFKMMTTEVNDNRCAWQGPWSVRIWFSC